MSGESQIETVDGAVAIGSLVGKSTPVLTRLPNGQVGFRMLTKVSCTASGVPVLRVELDNDGAVVVDREHVFYGRGMVERVAATLEAGMVLETSFHYPPGYVFQGRDGGVETSPGGVRVRGVTDAGTADVFGGFVNETQCYFTSAGVLCKA